MIKAILLSCEPHVSSEDILGHDPQCALAAQAAKTAAEATESAAKEAEKAAEENDALEATSKAAVAAWRASQVQLCRYHAM